MSHKELHHSNRKQKIETAGFELTSTAMYAHRSDTSRIKHSVNVTETAFGRFVHGFRRFG